MFYKDVTQTKNRAKSNQSKAKLSEIEAKLLILVSLKWFKQI